MLPPATWDCHGTLGQRRAVALYFGRDKHLLIRFLFQPPSCRCASFGRAGARPYRIRNHVCRQRGSLTCGRRILVNPLSRLSSRCQYARPKETLRINVFLLAHGQRNRDVRERAIPKSDDHICFTGHRCMYRVSGQEIA
jgi:hypothetical protein